MSNINKNWFYKLSELNTDKLVIENWISAIFFDDVSKPIDLELWENSKVEIYGVLQNVDDFNLNVFSNHESSTLKVRYLLLAWESEITKAKIKSSLEASHTKSDLKIVSIVQNNWFIDIDWIVEIWSWIEKVDWHLLEENIFLWNSGKVRWIPTLLVKSDDVKASHACRIERISDDKLFYLRSRGIEKENAVSMMIEAKVVDLFSCLSMIDSEFYNNLIKNILEKVKN